MASPDLWVVCCRNTSYNTTLDSLKPNLDRRQAAGSLSYRIVDVQDLVFSVQNNKFYLYVNGELEKHLPKVAFAHLPTTPNFSTHIINAIRQLEVMGVRCINSSESMLVCRNKFRQLQLLAPLGFKMPDSATYGTDTATGLTQLVQAPLAIDFPAILKSADANGGKRVMLLPSGDVAEDIRGSLLDDSVYLLQEYIKASHGVHFRALCVGGKVEAAYKIQNTVNTRVQSNCVEGGTFSTIEGEEEMKSMALTITKTIGLDISGIDFLIDKNGEIIFLEANACPMLCVDDATVDAVIDFFLTCSTK
ncbi:beta-citrylglutamate synthase B [Aplysia californica]|uniref:Beta-citrylglutamate synthase B n=1 Tax=Aplysia californica TaxID=6500 RepID=A0ABM0JGA0_APLCA|nr:beta-citrylglutamate synthase B [Aplysia californica]